LRIHAPDNGLILALTALVIVETEEFNTFMTDKLVGGVDFSGAKTVPNDTWFALAKVTGLGVEIVDITKVGSHALAKEVASKARIAALGIDCPFSLPIDFMQFLAAKQPRKEYSSWQEMAQDVAFMSMDDFIALVKEFKKEPKRLTDTLSTAAAQSPLHRGNPSMVQMTYHGIRLLAMLDPKTFFVVPFQESIPFGCAVIEVYPRALLKTLGLPDVNYKSADKNEQDKVQATRERIANGLVSLRDRKGLTYQKFPRLHLAKRWINQAVDSDHALDAILACYATAIYVTEPGLFKDPLETDNLDVLFEGWIYNPEVAPA
jgi:hypothetical protein